MIVVDTNVVVYLLTASGPHRAAEALLRTDPEWAAPLILFSELRNLLVGMTRRGWLDAPAAHAAHDDAHRIFAGRIVAVDGARVLDRALETGLSAYDAEFVVAARSLSAPLVTVDKEVLAAAPDVAVPLA